MKSPITTHVLDTARGMPAANLPVKLELCAGHDSWGLLAEAATDTDGRISNLLRAGSLSAGTYRLSFDTAAYFARLGQQCFYPYIQIVFAISQTEQHYHVPLLLSPFAYSTYRGS